MFYLAPFPS